MPQDQSNNRPNTRTDRRAFLTAAAAGAATLVAAPSVLAAPSGIRTARSGYPKNIILMVADGMSMGTYQIADRLNVLINGKRTNWSRLYEQSSSFNSLVATNSANSEVTDSAAAASAWGTGVLHPNGSIGIDEQGVKRTPLGLRALHAGKAIGLVTTTRLTHATPAGFSCNVKSRNDEHTIAKQMLARGFHVLLGGGREFITDDLATSMFSPARIAHNKHELAAITPGDHLLGVFSDDHMAYELDRSETEQPSLAEMATTAIKHLTAHPRSRQGFFLMVEGGRVDHGAHANDAGGMIHDQLAFDRAVGDVMKFAGTRNDTLVIVTTDHGNASPGLTFYGPKTTNMVSALTKWTRSFEWIQAQARVNESGAAQRLLPIVKGATGVGLTGEEADMVARAFAGERVNVFDGLSKPHHCLGGALGNHCGVGFLSGNHTSEYVIQTAVGPGAEFFPHMHHLTDTHDILAGLMGLGRAQKM